MKKIYIVFTCILLGLFCSAQIKFQSGFGDTMTDIGTKVVKTSNGGYCIIGTTEQNHKDTTDIAVYFVNYLGEMSTSVIIGLSRNEFPTGLVETSDSGFIISGTTYSSPIDTTHSDIFALKINSVGDVLWSNIYGGADDDDAQSIMKTPDNNFVIVGSTKSYGSASKSALVLKIDENGDQKWCNVSSASLSNYFNQGDITYDKQYILGGGSFNGSSDDNYIVKMDTSGSIIWSKRYGTNGADWISDIKTTSDSGFIIAGISSENTAGDTDQNVIKLDSTGGLTWAYNYGTSNYDRSFSIIENSSHHFIVCGYTNISPPGSTINQLVLDEIDSAGNVVWANIYGDSIQTSEGYYLIPGQKDGYAAVGFSVIFEPNGDAFFLKTDDNGIGGCYEFPISLIQNSSPLTVSSGAVGILVQLNHQSIAMTSNNFTDSYAQDCVIDNIKNITTNNSANNSARLYPNPAGKLLNIEMEMDDATATVFDQLGRSILKQKFNSPKTTIDLSFLSPGVYFLELKSKNKLSRNKFIKE